MIKNNESVIGESNYVRAFRCLLIAAEAVDSMKWEAFWKIHNRSDYASELNTLSELLSSLHDKDPIDSKSLFENAWTA